jgi:glycerol-3-phosphate dehydrogenase
MNRKDVLARFQEQRVWDLIIIGGGATGLGIAVDAATRGYSALLLEKDDFAKGTSSRSTKLVHGGVRYLAQGNIKLVREALHERGLLLKNAPHLTRQQEFVMPAYHWWSKPFYGTGLKIYDLLSGKLGIGETRFLGKKEVIERIPVAEPGGLRGGIAYFDGQFDDARLAVCLARTAYREGASVINHVAVEGLIKETNKLKGVKVVDLLSGEKYDLQARSVVNATGVFADWILHMDDPANPPIVAPSQGVHLVLEKKFFPGDSALMIPSTSDGRVLFAVPWQGRVIVGTTDTPVNEVSSEPRALKEEMDFIISHFNRYLTSKITEKDIRSVYAGLRPLVRSANSSKTSLLSREHTILVSPSGLVTITGGKWTTYRKMAKDAVDNAAFVGKLAKRPCVTDTLRLVGWTEGKSDQGGLALYGSDAGFIRQMIVEEPLLGEKIHPGLPDLMAEVAWAVREEMACTIEDVLARRTRLLFLDARIASASAYRVGDLLSKLLGWDAVRKEKEIEVFRELCKGYLP